MLVVSSDERVVTKVLDFEIVAIDEDGYELEESDLEYYFKVDHYEIIDHYEIRDRVDGYTFGKYSTEEEAKNKFKALINAYVAGEKCFRF